MTRNTSTQSGPSLLPDRLLWAAFLGLLAGVGAALLDVKEAASELDNGFEILLVLLQAIARVGLLGAVLGLMASAIVNAGGALGERLDRPRTRVAIWVTTAASFPGLLYIAIRLFQGGTASKAPARGLLIVITALILVCLFWLGARIVLNLIESADRGEPALFKLVMACTVFGCLGFGLHWCDAHLYRRLYLYLHSALGLGTLGSFALVLRISPLSDKLQSTTRQRLAIASLVFVAVLFAIAVKTFDLRQTVKTASWDNTATLADVLRSTSLFRGERGLKVPSKEIRAIREERARRAKVVSSGEWPVFPESHVLLITIDALRADRLGVYGHKTRNLSPNLDRWALEKGVVFERAYCSAPHSSYSITSLHTSRFTYDEAMLSREIKHPTLAQVLQGKGYSTTAFYTQGIFFTEGDRVGHYRRNRFGFERAVHGTFRPDEVTDMAIDAISSIVVGTDKPFFIWAHYFNVHEPYLSTRFGTSPADRYDGEIFETDSEVNRLLEYVEETLAGDAIVLLSADHGEEFKDHGGYYHGSSLYDEQVRVPLIIQVPSGRQGRVLAPVSIAGLAPTVLNLVGITPPSTMIGQDLRPGIFAGDDKHVPQPVFASVMHHHMVVRWPWKLIADPSRELYELYNLKSDPLERVNLYDRKQTIANELLQEIYAWLDGVAEVEDETRTILNLGHMHDLRSVPGLVRIAVNPDVSVSERVEAIQLLGEIRNYSVISLLKPLIEDSSDRVAIAAALTLGTLGDRSGQDFMHDALFDEDPFVRDSAALVLGRLGDFAAAPGLIEALGRQDVKMREQAIRMLGRLGDPDTIEPLLEMLAEDRTRYLVVLALGKIGNPEAYDALMDVLDNDGHTDVRGYSVVALGWLELPQAIPRIVRMLDEEPEIKWSAETLVRLGGIGRAPVFGTDVARGSSSLKRGFGGCLEKPKIVHGEFLGRTTCRTTGRAAELGFHADAPEGAIVILRVRHLLDDKGQVADLILRVDGKEMGRAALLGEFQEFRIQTPAGAWPQGNHRVVLSLDRDGKFEVDHLLVLAQ
ncbi:MAG: sulfatase-like hydrolase/transferase [Proteobacteria bacterium]|nr:sulfatase-like hydrolase/transferase [Pseudomonadota bacterium]